ncbi:putative adhesin [Pseudomonas sp. F1_0610]|uniref:putative adhesin n=1 Tax=Pseudomonas sp. F1_0610 TaxID=3114284 RepID=UPI0039C05EB3
MRNKEDIQTYEDITGLKIYRSGDHIPNYTLNQPDEKIIYYSNSRTVQDPTELYQILKPNMGCVVWAACTLRNNRK